MSCAVAEYVIQPRYEDAHGAIARRARGSDRSRGARAQSVEIGCRPRVPELCSLAASTDCLARHHRQSYRLGERLARRPERAEEEISREDGLWPEAFSLTPVFWSLFSA